MFGWLDESVKRQLAAQAKDHGRSMEAEVREILTRSASRPHIGLALMEAARDVGGIDELPVPERSGVAITAITLAELLACVRRLPDGERKSVLSTRIDAALQPYWETRAVLAFDDKAADHYADVLVGRGQAGLPISTADAQIAAICLARSAVCATRNTKDCAQTGIDLVDPWAA